MPRTRPEGRLEALVEAAVSLFGRHGYRRTQIADVAAEVGLSPGAVYGYVAGKEALFDLAVRRAFEDPLPEEDLPWRAPPMPELVARVDTLMRRRLRTPGLAAAVRTDLVTDPRAELETLVAEQYDMIARNARAVRLMDRCAADRPELAELYLARGRTGLIGRWGRYLARRIEAGLLPPVPDPAIAGRVVIETIAWFAMHRHGDKAPQKMDDALARETVVTVLCRGLACEEDST